MTNQELISLSEKLGKLSELEKRIENIENEEES